MIHANSNDARRFKRFALIRIENEARRFAADSKEGE
jgi:hypothetical protein